MKNRTNNVYRTACKSDIIQHYRLCVFLYRAQVKEENVMRQKTRDMTSGKPAGIIVSFALPLMLGNVFQQLYTVMDSVIVGRGVGVEALAPLELQTG